MKLLRAYNLWVLVALAFLAVLFGLLNNVLVRPGRRVSLIPEQETIQEAK